MRTLIGSLLFTIALVPAAHGQPPFSVGPVTAQPGTVASGTIAVPGRTGDDGTSVPISVIHGTKPAPVLALVAGVYS